MPERELGAINFYNVGALYNISKYLYSPIASLHTRLGLFRSLPYIPVLLLLLPVFLIFELPTSLEI